MKEKNYHNLRDGGMYLYHLTHIDNIPSVLSEGLFSRNILEAKDENYKDLSIEGIQKLRQKYFMKHKNKDIHNYVPFYFKEHNPLLRRKISDGKYDFCLLHIDYSIFLNCEEYYFTDRGTPHKGREYYDDIQFLPKLDWGSILFNATKSSSRRSRDEAFMASMSEALILKHVPPEFIKKVYVISDIVLTKIDKKYKSKITVDSYRFGVDPKFARLLSDSPNISTELGNIFRTDAQAIVNPVNVVGVMGKGLAKQFKEKYPDMFDDYKKTCNAGELKIGELHLYDTNDKLIINFPTKEHWRNKSKLEYIEKGLEKLKDLHEEGKLQRNGELATKIAMPLLGAGLGGLNAKMVVNLIDRILGNIENLEIEIVIYELSK